MLVHTAMKQRVLPNVVVGRSSRLGTSQVPTSIDENNSSYMLLCSRLVRMAAMRSRVLLLLFQTYRVDVGGSDAMAPTATEDPVKLFRGSSELFLALTMDTPNISDPRTTVLPPNTTTQTPILVFLAREVGCTRARFITTARQSSGILKRTPRKARASQTDPNQPLPPNDFSRLGNAEKLYSSRSIAFRHILRPYT